MYEHHDAQDNKEGDKGKYHRSASTSPFAVIIASNQGEDKFAENYDCADSPMPLTNKARPASCQGDGKPI
jgi:hypothetical protein